MGKIAVMTDSNSGMMKDAAKALGIYLLPMPVYIDDVMYFENETITREEFFEKQTADAQIHTSQPVVGDLLDRWDKLLLEYDRIVYIPMSSGLS